MADDGSGRGVYQRQPSSRRELSKSAVGTLEGGSVDGFILNTLREIGSAVEVL